MFQRLKSLIYLLFIFSTSASLYLLNYVSNSVSQPVTDTFIENWQFVCGYIVFVGLVSFAIMYRYGPIENERTLKLIKWLLQGIGLVLVYNSTQLTEVSCALVLGLLTIYNFPRIAVSNQTTKNLW